MQRRPIKHFLEYLLVLALYYPSRLFSIDATSAFFGLALEKIGPLLKPAANKRIKRNIAICFPDFSPEKVDETARKSWNNLGRFIGEFPHMEKLSGEALWGRVKVEGTHHLDAAVKSGKGCIVFSGHFANWEIIAKSSYEYGVPPALIYRPANNRLVNKLILKARGKSHAGIYGKGAESTRGIFKVLKKKGVAGMLVDQKTNEGLKLKFFGRDAMTTPGPAQLALALDCILLPVVVFRENGANFLVRVEPPLQYEKTGDGEKDAAAIMQQINDILERWVREHPEQWLWLHRRWVEN